MTYFYHLYLNTESTVSEPRWKPITDCSVSFRVITFVDFIYETVLKNTQVKSSQVAFNLM